MKTKQLTPVGYNNKVVESSLNNYANELTDFAKIQAQHDGQKKSGISHSQFKIKILDVVQAKTQQSIYYIIREMKIAVEVIKVREEETIGEKQVANNEVEIKNKKLIIAEAERNNSVTFSKKQIGNAASLISILAFIVGVVDALVAYSNFRLASYPKPLATLAAIVVFFFVAVTHLFLTPYVKNGTTSKARIVRIITILVFGFVVFYSLAQVRTSGLNNEINLSNFNVATEAEKSSISPWPISFLSFGLFAGVFFASLFFWKSKQEQEVISSNKANLTKLSNLKKEIKTLETQNKTILENIKSQKDWVREMYAYCKASILRAKNNGQLAIAIYKQSFADYTDIIPTFFNDANNLDYDDEIDFFKPEN